MPTYAYLCPKGHAHERVQTIARRNESSPCPVCKRPARRDLVGSMRPHTDLSEETYSEAMGVHPAQIAEAQQKFPHHKFTPDGRMIFTSYGERKKVLKELGFHDRDGVSG